MQIFAHSKGFTTILLLLSLSLLSSVYYINYNKGLTKMWITLKPYVPQENYSGRQCG